MAKLGDSGVYWAKAKDLGWLAGLGVEERCYVMLCNIEVERVSGCG